MSHPVYYVPSGDVLPVFFSSYAGATGASVTLTGLAVTDIEIYKDGGATQRSSDAGYTLLDTDGIDFDGITGIHGFSIDTSDNTDAGFYTVGAWFHVVVSAVTVDSQTVNFVACAFRLMAAEAVAGKPKTDVDAFGGTAGTFSGGRPEVNTSHAAGTAWGSGAITAASIAADAITAAKIADGAIDANTFATGAITAAAIAADAIGASELAADAIAEIADAVWDEDATGHQTGGTFGQAIGDPGADTNTIFKAVVTDATGATVGVDVAAVLDDTGTAGVVVASLNANVITATAINADAITAAKLAADVTTELQSGLATAAALSTVDGKIDTIDNFLDTEIAAILADTNELQTDWADGGRLDLIVDAILADTGTDGVVVAAASKTGYRLSATGVDDVLDEAVEGSYTLRQYLRGFAAALLAKASGLETTNAIYRDTGDTKNRIDATVTADGNRTAVTLDLT